MALRLVTLVCALARSCCAAASCLSRSLTLAW